MSAEKESYATQQDVSHVKIPGIKKTCERLIFNKRPPGLLFAKQRV